MLAMMMAAVFTFTSCGGDDEEGDNGSESENIGVHRIDLQFSGNAAGCSADIFFYGMKPDGSYAALYENGEALVLDKTAHAWVTKEIRDMSVQTEDGCGALMVSVTITGPNGRSVASDVTVTAVGYVNGKRVKTQVLTLPAGSFIMAGEFDTANKENYPEVVE